MQSLNSFGSKKDLKSSLLLNMDDNQNQMNLQKSQINKMNKKIQNLIGLDFNDKESNISNNFANENLRKFNKLNFYLGYQYQDVDKNETENEINLKN